MTRTQGFIITLLVITAAHEADLIGQGISLCLIALLVLDSVIESRRERTKGDNT